MRARLSRLCKYEVLEPLLLHLVTKSRVTALVVGSGTSTFPEQLYDRQVQDRRWHISCH